MAEKIEVLLDTHKCQGYGLCLGMDDVFELQDDANLARLKQRFIDVARLEEIRQIAHDCPAGAITHRIVQD